MADEKEVKNVKKRGPNRALTRRQEKFVREIVGNDGLITGTEAAIRAGFTARSAYQRAYELQNPKINPHVVAEIQRYRDELDELYAVDYKRHVRDMKVLRDAASAAGAHSAAVQAEKNRGLAEGLYVSKSEVRHGSIDSMSREDVEKELERIRESFEPIDITPEIIEPDAEGSVDAAGVGLLETDVGRADEDGPEDSNDKA
jgi:phage terminase small subunit